MTYSATPLSQCRRNASSVALSHHHVFPDRAVAPSSNAPRIQIAAGAVTGTSGSGIHAAAERSKYVRQAMAPYETQTFHRSKRGFPGALSNSTRPPKRRGSAIVQRTAFQIAAGELHHLRVVPDPAVA